MPNRPEPFVGSAIFAAGAGLRYECGNKLLVELEGRCVIERVVSAHNQAGLKPLVVLGRDADRIAQRLSQCDWDRAFNPNWEDGMGGSVALAAKRWSEREAGGLLLCVGDLPRLSSKTVAGVLAAFASTGWNRVTRPRFRGVPGHPVAVPPRLIPKLAALSGAEGARQIFQRCDRFPMWLDVAEADATSDLDSAEDERRFRRARSKGPLL